MSFCALPFSTPATASNPAPTSRKTDIAVLFEGRITYQGEELRQDDETVRLQLIHLAKEQPLGQVVEIHALQLLQGGWTGPSARAVMSACATV